MDTSGSALAAAVEATVFLGYFKGMPDHRQAGKVAYPLDEVLLLALMAVLAGAEGFTDIARFGEKKLDLLRRFRPFRNGTPSHDHLGDIFAALDAQAFRCCFVGWVGGLTGTPPEVIAIDGKTSRRSGSKGARDALHTVSAFAARERLVLAQVKTATKSNEITAIPALLDLLSIEGAVITIDAMGCQREIARKIVDKGADYVLALKGNQASLLGDVEILVKEQKSVNFAQAKISTCQTIDADHGRIETRHTTLIHDVGWLQDRHDWPGLKAVIVIDSTREIGAKSERETRLYLTSSPLNATELAPMVRDHRAIENSLHWVLDMAFKDDESRVRTDQAPENFVTIKHMAANLARKTPGRDSIRLRLKTAAWDDDYLANLIKA
jgi:predicted transposase YbfD/YdcC